MLKFAIPLLYNKKLIHDVNNVKIKIHTDDEYQVHGAQPVLSN